MEGYWLVLDAITRKPLRNRKHTSEISAFRMGEQYLLAYPQRDYVVVKYEEKPVPCPWRNYAERLKVLGLS